MPTHTAATVKWIDYQRAADKQQDDSAAKGEYKPDNLSCIVRQKVAARG